jgi:hypothetical protein
MLRNRRWLSLAARLDIKIARKIHSSSQDQNVRDPGWVSDEVTVRSAVLLDEQRNASDITRCTEACLR